MEKTEENGSATLDRDWLRAQLEGVVDWALDIATKLANDDQEDLDAIERVRAFVREWIAGRRAEIPLTDLLTTIAILMTAIELDDGLDGISVLAPLATMLETPHRLPAVVRCPGADEPVVRRRRRRFPSPPAAFTRFAA